MIVMDPKVQFTVDIIAKAVEGRITIANAAKLLSKSRRTIERYVKRYSNFRHLPLSTLTINILGKHLNRFSGPRNGESQGRDE